MPVISTPKKRATAPRAKSGADGAKAVVPKISRELLLRRLRTEYTPAVCESTLAVNESLPVRGKS